MTNRKIQLIGLGAGGIDTLPTSHKELIFSADLIFGAERHLEDIPANIKKKSWSKNIRNDLKKIKNIKRQFLMKVIIFRLKLRQLLQKVKKINFQETL